MTDRSRKASYDDDFYAWTRDQAEALRRLPPDAAGNTLDIAHVAEEIEDLGKRDLREVESFLARLFEHLLKLHACPGSDSRLAWRGECRLFQSGAVDAFSPSMAKLIDMPKIWRRGAKAAAAFFEDRGIAVAIPADCPFSLDLVMAEDFTLDVVLAVLAEDRSGGA